MKPCPFCGEKVEASYPFMFHVENRGKWHFSHYCKSDDLSVCVDVYGKTEKECIKLWNRRADSVKKHLAE